MGSRSYSSDFGEFLTNWGGTVKRDPASATLFGKSESKSGRQEALLCQRDRTTRLSVEILQLQNIPFDN